MVPPRHELLSETGHCCGPAVRHSCLPLDELRAPKRLYLLPEELHDPTGPVFGEARLGPADNDLALGHAGADPLGERIVVSGRVLDSGGRPIANTLLTEANLLRALDVRCLTWLSQAPDGV